MFRGCPESFRRVLSTLKLINLVDAFRFVIGWRGEAHPSAMRDSAQKMDFVIKMHVIFKIKIKWLKWETTVASVKKLKSKLKNLNLKINI